MLHCPGLDHGRKFNLLDSLKESFAEFEIKPQIYSLGAGNCYVWAEEGDVAFHAMYYGPNGSLLIAGENIIFDQKILKHVFQDSDIGADFIHTLPTEVSAESANLLARIVHSLAEEGVLDAAEAGGLRAGVSLEHRRTAGKREFVDERPNVKVKNLVLSANNVVRLDNGSSLKVLGDLDVLARAMVQNGAKLHHKIKSMNLGLFASAGVKTGMKGDSAGPSIDAGAGIRAGKGKDKGHAWLAGSIDVAGHSTIHLTEWRQKAATFWAGSASGHVTDFQSTTRNDHARSTNMSASVSVTGDISFNFGTTKTRKATHESGVTIIADSTLTFDNAETTGARIHNVDVNNRTRHAMAKQLDRRGFDVGVSFNVFMPSKATASIGVTDKGKGIRITVPLETLRNLGSGNGGGAHAKALGNLFNIAGTVTYWDSDAETTYNIPVITGINADAWRALGADLKTIGETLSVPGDSPSDAMKRLWSGSRKDDMMRELAMTAEEFDVFMANVQLEPVDQPYEETGDEGGASASAAYNYEEADSAADALGPQPQLEEVDDPVDDTGIESVTHPEVDGVDTQTPPIEFDYSEEDVIDLAGLETLNLAPKASLRGEDEDETNEGLDAVMRGHHFFSEAISLMDTWARASASASMLYSTTVSTAGFGGELNPRLDYWQPYSFLPCWNGTVYDCADNFGLRQVELMGGFGGTFYKMPGTRLLFQNPDLYSRVMDAYAALESSSSFLTQYTRPIWSNQNGYPVCFYNDFRVPGTGQPAGFHTELNGKVNIHFGRGASGRSGLFELPSLMAHELIHGTSLGQKFSDPRLVESLAADIRGLKNLPNYANNQVVQDLAQWAGNPVNYFERRFRNLVTEHYGDYADPNLVDAMVKDTRHKFTQDGVAPTNTGLGQSSGLFGWVYDQAMQDMCSEIAPHLAQISQAQSQTSFLLFPRTIMGQLSQMVNPPLLGWGGSVPKLGWGGSSASNATNHFSRTSLPPGVTVLPKDYVIAPNVPWANNFWDRNPWAAPALNIASKAMHWGTRGLRTYESYRGGGDSQLCDGRGGY